MEVPEGLAALTEAVSLAEHVNNTFAAAHGLRNRAVFELRAGHLERALSSIARALDFFDRSRDRGDVHYPVDVIARALTLMGHDGDAALLFGAILAGSFAFIHQSERQAALDVLSARLGPQALAALLAQGRSLSLDELVVVAQAAVAKALAPS
jgi:hypothetical protein